FACAVALAIASAGLWWHLGHPVRMNMQAAPLPTEQSASTTSAEGSSTPIQEASLAPIQLSSQQMQSIGVVLGKVQEKSVTSDLRFYGNVQVDERRQAYVQT